MSGLVIARNALFNIASFVVTMAVTFLLVPVMLFYLGPVGFGVWAIARVFVSYASLSDFGLSSTITKFVAELYPQREFQKLIRILQSAFILYTLIALLVVGLVWVFDNLLISTFFSTSGEFGADIRFVLLCSMAIFAVNLVGTVFSAAINGLQRMQITNGITIVYWSVNGVLMYAALVAGLGLRGIVYANAIATAVSVACHAFFFFRLFGDLPLMRLRLHAADIIESVRFSKDIFIISIANSVHLHYDKLLLSSMVSLDSVSSYEVASRIIQAMRQVVVLMLNPILPVASELQAQDRGESLHRLYIRTVKYLVVFCFPLFAGVGVLAGPIITLWLGPNHELVVTTLQLLLAANLLNLLTGPAYFISIGVGKARLAMASATVGLVLNGILSYVFLQSFGYLGLLLGTSLSLGFEALLFLYLFHRGLRIEWSTVLRLLPQPLIATLLAAGGAIAVGSLLSSALLKFLFMSITALGIYLLAILNPSYFDSRDWEFVREIRGRVMKTILPAREKD